ncbi:MAG: DUF1992 domain-containing protein [Rubrivivax sp.]|nr:DUF1992 domain-containing protein [Rubrivivax sp.]
MTSPIKPSAEKREQRLKLLDDHIGRALAESERNGELKSAPSYGRPLDLGDGYDATPDELKMPMKMLKDAGIVPPEVETMREIAALRDQLAALPEGDERQALQRRMAERQQALALRLKKLRSSGSL